MILDFFPENTLGDDPKKTQIRVNGFDMEIIDYAQSGMMYLRRTYRVEVRIPRQSSVRQNISAS